jgi:iron complex transport system substrate-binding protein
MNKNLKSKIFTIVAAMSICTTLTIGFTACSSKTTSQTNSSAAEQKKTTQEIVDMAGRKVTIPSQIKKVYSTSPIGTTFMYTLAPEKIAGVNYKLSEGEKKFTNASYNKLPVLGGNFGQGQTINKEELLKVKPDIILNMGDLTKTTVAESDKIQTDIGIPVIYVTGDLDKLDKAYEFMGKITGDASKAKELGDYCKKTYDEIKGIAAKIPEDKKIKVYYAEGPKGLQTDPKGSSHTQLLDLVGASNIADLEVKQGYGRNEMSIEQLIKWNPETILVCFEQSFVSASQNPYKLITSDSSWSHIKAVQNKKVYVIPYLPYNWFDRPPSVMRILGAKWLGNLLYPDNYKYDMKAETKEFYDKFFHVKVTDQQYEEIIANAK